jgi:hypothetical protein
MKKGSSKCISIAKQVVPQSWGTSNSTFVTDTVGDIEISFVEYSSCKKVRLQLDIVEYSPIDQAPMYDLIIGKQTMHNLGVCVDLSSGQRGSFPILRLTKAYWMYPPPRNLITTIKAKLRHTQALLSSNHQANSHPHATEVRLWHVRDVQIHRLFPPPLVWDRPPLSLTLSAFLEDWSSCNVHHDCLLVDLNVLRYRLHPAFRQNIRRFWVDPLLPRAPPQFVSLPHAPCSPDVEPLQSRHCLQGDDPRLAVI